MKWFFSYVTGFASLVMAISLLSGCGNTPNLANSSTPSPSAWVGNTYSPGDEVPIVYNPSTGGYEQKPIPGVSTPTSTPAMITYTGVSN